MEEGEGESCDKDSVRPRPRQISPLLSLQTHISPPAHLLFTKVGQGLFYTFDSVRFKKK